MIPIGETQVKSSRDIGGRKIKKQKKKKIQKAQRRYENCRRNKENLRNFRGLQNARINPLVQNSKGSFRILSIHYLIYKKEAKFI